MTDIRRKHVVIVDDDGNVLRSLRIVLRRLYEVDCFMSATEALDSIRRRRPDVVVTDLKMPDHDGFWLFREILAVDPKIPVIFNSAFQDTMTYDEVKGAVRPFGVLSKNGSLETFLKLLSTALA